MNEARRYEKTDILAFHENPLYCKDENGKKVYKNIIQILKPNLIVCGHVHAFMETEFCRIKLFNLYKEKGLTLK